MSTERSIHEPDKQGFISSIHNYCDRRCEKCRFIRQCRVGIMEADDVDDDREPGDERVEDYEARLRKVMGVPEDDDDDNEDDGDEKKDAVVSVGCSWGEAGEIAGELTGVVFSETGGFGK